MGVKGYDTFFEKPGKIDKKNCEVCGTECNVKRGVMGATCFAQAVGGGRSLHDYFYCPNNEQKWHEKAVEMKMELNDTKSPSLRKIIQKDIDELIKHGTRKNKV